MAEEEGNTYKKLEKMMKVNCGEEYAVRACMNRFEQGQVPLSESIPSATWRHHQQPSLIMLNIPLGNHTLNPIQNIFCKKYQSNMEITGPQWTTPNDVN